ncbi:MAG: hypothetical protein V2I33_24235 [Kangiellaceae bacterium]|jgi:hypothetical protein|nr:hypothetical protein [Kangiellaceae bacterium]
MMKKLYSQGATKGDFVFISSFWFPYFNIVSENLEMTPEEKDLANGSLEFIQALTVGEKGEWYLTSAAEAWPQYKPPDRWGCLYFDAIHDLAMSLSFLLTHG